MAGKSELANIKANIKEAEKKLAQAQVSLKKIMELKKLEKPKMQIT